MSDSKEEARLIKARTDAAERGCGICSGPVYARPAGDPFSKGPYVGRYWCADCWTLYWDEHPEHLADEESRNYTHQEAKQIKLKRGSKLIFEEGENRAFKTSKGTIVFDFRTSKELALNEYDPARLALLLRALKVMEEPAVTSVTAVA